MVCVAALPLGVACRFFERGSIWCGNASTVLPTKITSGSITYYGNEPAEMAVFWRTQRQSFAPLYWTMIGCNFLVPLVLMGIRRFRTIIGCVIASFAVIVGMWLERFLIIVPSLGAKYLPYSVGIYRPQPVEILITIATFAMVCLLYVLFGKFIPIISIWELKGGEPRAPKLAPAADEPQFGRVQP